MQIDLDIGGIYYFVWSVLILLTFISFFQLVHETLVALNSILASIGSLKHQSELQHRSLMAALANREKQAPQPAALV